MRLPLLEYEHMAQALEKHVRTLEQQAREAKKQGGNRG